MEVTKTDDHVFNTLMNTHETCEEMKKKLELDHLEAIWKWQTELAESFQHILNWLEK